LPLTRFSFFLSSGGFSLFPLFPLQLLRLPAPHEISRDSCEYNICLFFYVPPGVRLFFAGRRGYGAPKNGRQMWLRFELRTNVALHTHVCGITHTQFHSKTHVHVWERMYIRIHTHVWGFRAYQLFRGSCCQMCVCVYLSDQCGITHTYVNKHKPACACEGFELIAFYRLQLPDVCVCVLV